MGSTEGTTGPLRAEGLVDVAASLVPVPGRVCEDGLCTPDGANGGQWHPHRHYRQGQVPLRPNSLLLLMCCCWAASKPRTSRPAGASALVSFSPSSSNRMRRLLPAYQTPHMRRPRGATRPSRRRPADPATYKKTGQIPPSTEEQRQRRNHDTK